jgi:hypothetical protein
MAGCAAIEAIPEESPFAFSVQVDELAEADPGRHRCGSVTNYWRPNRPAHSI